MGSRFPSLLAVVFWSALSAGAQSARGIAIPADTSTDSAFDAAQSAALFIGVREFTHDPDLAVVPYAVDDAVDLAYAMAMDRPFPLVHPSRVALSLSGQPQKPSSRERLALLRSAGASVHPAAQSDLLLLLGRQSRLVGKSGMLIVSIATHGFTAAGEHYLVTASSLLPHYETALSLSKVLDITHGSAAKRSMIFIDACRRRMTTNARSSDASATATAPILNAIAGTRGHAVFHAAVPGQYAYDDERRGNGVFTAALVDGLRCEAAADARGLVTVGALADYVDRRVAEWVRTNRDDKTATGIQVTTDSGGKAIPVALCRSAKDADQHYVATDLGHIVDRSEVLADQQPAVVRAVENGFHVLNGAGVRLWGATLGGTVVRTELVDLDGDNRSEVVAGLRGTGADAGKLIAFNPDGSVRWSRETTGPLNYGSGRSGRMTVVSFATGDLFRNGTRQIVALSIDAQGWYPSRVSVFDHAGTLLSSYWHPGHLAETLIAAPTATADPRIIVSGVNNDLRSVLGESSYVGAVLVLDPRNMRGEAPPFAGRAGVGTHLWYGVLLPSGNRVERLEIVDTNQDGVNEISMWCTSGDVFYVSFDGRLISKARSDGAKGGGELALVEVTKK